MDNGNTTRARLLRAICLCGMAALNSLPSSQAWSWTASTAPEHAPDIVIILLDDVGFGATSTFGGPAQTPALDQLAAQGLRYNRFHTAGVCSPTRASLLTGHNHHRVGFGIASGAERDQPGYRGLWPAATASVATVLRQHGYGTAAFGKWHNTPNWEISPIGPFDRWPTGLGFDYFYGFMGGETSQWEPVLFRNTTLIDPVVAGRENPERTAPELPEKTQPYHFTADIVDEAIGWLNTRHALAPTQPSFLYLATGAAHAPLHVPQEWIDRYRGQFDQGWDALRQQVFERQKRMGVIPPDTRLTPRPAELPAWDSLPADQRRLLARQMEVYAAFLAHTDHEIGRLLEAVQRGPRADNTLIIYIVGDNGGSSEGGLNGSDNNIAEQFMGASPDPLAQQLERIDQLGGPAYDNHYASAWAWAGSTPFQWMKQVASHFGATRNPMVIAWPERIKDKGGLRQQFTHVIDVVPTLYELIGIDAPETVDGVAQQPLDGRSFAYSLERGAPEPPRTQYFEMMGNRAIYKDGWMASARHGLPWQLFQRNTDYAGDRWELYHIAEDFSQAEDLAGRYPDKLKALQALFKREATANQVLPMGIGLPNPQGQPSLYHGRDELVFKPGMPGIPTTAAPALVGSHRITATLDMPADGGEGVIVANGGRYGGFTLYVQNDRLVYENNYFDKQRDVLVSSQRLPAGPVRVAFEYVREDPQLWGGGTGKLFIDGELVATGRFANVGMPTHFDSFAIGREHGSPVSDAYQSPFRFTGALEEVRIQMH